MLLGENHAPFDDPSCIFELKADGIRGLAYLEPMRGTDLRNKRNMLLAGTFPELSELHLQVDRPCILDGKIIVTGPGGAPDFFQVQKRALMSNRTKISLAASQQPATFLAFDILYLDGEELFFTPLMERKALLADTVREGGRLALSRYVEGHGVALYQLAEARDLEGVVAKPKESKYFQGRRSKDWQKIKHLVDDDYVITGYMPKENGVVSLVLGQYGPNDRLDYKGHVTAGVDGQAFQRIASQPPQDVPPFSPLPTGNERAVWIQPLVGVVSYMPSDKPGLRQPVFKGLRNDKLPRECIAT